MQRTSYVYKSFRDKGSIACLQIQSVPKGTFAKLKQNLVENRLVSPYQYKVSRVLRDPEVVQFMFDRRKLYGLSESELAKREESLIEAIERLEHAQL